MAVAAARADRYSGRKRHGRQRRRSRRRGRWRGGQRRHGRGSGAGGGGGGAGRGGTAAPVAAARAGAVPAAPAAARVAVAPAAAPAAAASAAPADAAAAAGGSGGSAAPAAPRALAAASVLDGQAWVLRCGAATGARRCTSANVITNNYPSSDPLGGRVSRNDFGIFGGAAGSPYCVTVRVRGITASKSYVNDSVTNRERRPVRHRRHRQLRHQLRRRRQRRNRRLGGRRHARRQRRPQRQRAAGRLAAPDLLPQFDRPPGRAPRTDDTSYVVDYTATFPIERRLVAAVHRRRLRRHHRRQLLAGPAGHLHPQHLGPLPAVREPPGTTIDDPFDGQFLIMTVTAARAGACTCPTPATCS